MQDQRFIFLNESKTFGWVWFILEYQFDDDFEKSLTYSYPVNEGFLYIPHESEVRPFAIVNSSGDLKEIKNYEVAGIFDVILNINDWGFTFRYHFINVKWKEYGTLYKQRLRDDVKIK
jgi:hypothetical protein